MRSHFRKISLLAITAVLLLSFSVEWSPSDKKFLTKIVQYNKINRQEKLCLHLDKPIYIAGEDIWFSIYLNEVSSNLPNKTERVVYVELLTPSGRSATKNIFKIENGRGAGQIALPDSLYAGHYQIVAYTNWMRNFGTDFYFKKEVTIVNDKNDSQTIYPQNVTKPTQTNLQSDIKPNDDQIIADDITLRFFPEGGNIIHGVLSKVAFEAKLKNGKPATFNGEILDHKGNSVAVIRPMWEGKGMFSFIPDASETYKAVINSTDTFNLPAVKEQGYQLSVESSFGSDKILIRVQGSANLHSKNIFALVMQGQKPMMAISDSLVNNRILIPIDKSKLNTGIAQITVFDDKKIPQCERLVFVNHHDFTTINIQPDNPTPGKRDKITLNITTLNQQGQPVPGTFSLAVTDANRINDKYYQPLDFISHNIFGSDLPRYKGDASFVTKKSPKSAIQTDLVMLTHGWRRYQWQEVLRDSISIPVFLEEPGIYLKGKVKKTSSKKLPDPGVKVFMRFKERDRGDRYATTTNENSEFTFIINDFTDSLSAVLTTKDQKQRFTDYAIDIESNLKFNSIDLKGRKMLTDLSYIDSVGYKNDSTPKYDDDLKKNLLTTELVRAKARGFFVDTADVSIDEVKILGTKIRNVKGVITSAYGAPSQSIGTRQIEDLSSEKDWNDGLISVIADAFPGLEIMEILSDSLDSEYLRFLSRDRKQHRFFIYVDGKMVGATDDKGVLKNMLHLYVVNDLISLDTDEVASVDLIYPQQGSSKFKLNSEALENASTDMMSSDKNISFSDTRLNYNEPVETTDPLNDLKTNPLYYSSPEAILSIYTKVGGGLYSRSSTEGVNKFYLTGYSRVKEFYSPDYSDDKLNVNKDKRSTLYWNPIITTDENGTAQVSFYNTDVTSMFRAEAVGFSKFGQAGNTRVVFGTKESDTPDVTQPTEKDSYAGKIANTKNENNIWSDKSKTKLQVCLKSGEAAPYAFVSVPAKDWTTITDTHGNFYIDDSLIDSSDTIFINYKINASLSVLRSSITNKTAPLVLEPCLTMEAQSIGADVFKDALRSIIKTKAKTIEYANSYYRQQIFKEGELQHLLDLKTELRLPRYGKQATGFTPNPIEGRIFKVENYDNNTAFTPYNNSGYKVPILDPFFTEVTFLNSSYGKYYDYTFLGTSKYQNRKMYKVAFDKKEKCSWTLSSGYALIDVENYGIAYLNWKVSDKSMKYTVPDMYLMGGTTHKDFQLTAEENQAFYSFVDGVWRFNAGVQNISFKLNKTNYSYEREMLVRNYLGKSLKSFKSTSLDKMKTRFILVKEPKYLPHLWRDAWLLPTNETIQKNIPYMHEIIFLSKPDEE